MRTTPPQRIEEMTARGYWGGETLDDLFRAAVEKRPDRIALIDPENRLDFTDGEPRRLTFAELATITANLAAEFQAAGLGPDDIVVVQLPNIAELAILYLALGRLGVVVSPVPVQYGRHELQRARDVLAPAAFISATNFRGVNLAREHAAVFEGETLLFSFGDARTAGARALTLTTEPRTSSTPPVGRSISADDVLTICWTSGTTGQPKGVPRSHNLWMASAIAAHDAAALTDEDVLLNPFPLVNMAGIGGMLFPWLMRACTLVLHQPFDMAVFLRQIQEERVSYTIAPPAALTMLLKRPEILDALDLSSLRSIGSGSAPLSEFMVRGFGRDHGIEIINIFGSNEGVCLTSGPDEVPDHGERARYFPRYGVPDLTWSNRTGNRIQTRLVSLASREVITGVGQPGELEIRGCSVFDGYYRSPEANAEVFSDDGWFRTGDVFEIAGEEPLPRFYRFVGRCKDLIIRGGINISPDEIDGVLAAHPKLADVCVVGLRDEVLGERIGVAVVPKPDETVSLRDITDFLRERGLAIFKLPERLVCADALPYNATGKIQRRDVKSLFDRDS